MPTISLFPTLVHSHSLTKAKRDRLNKDLLSDIMVLKKIDSEGQLWSKQNYVGGYTSYSSISDLHLRHSPFMNLKSIVDIEVKKFVRSLELDLLGRKLEMTTCWVNVMPQLVHHSLHLHPLGCISGTYYVQVPSGAGQLKLEDPRMGLFMASPPRKQKTKKMNPYFYSIAPKSGQILLWESWLRHEVMGAQGP